MAAVRLGPHGIPFRLIVRGKEWKVRWGDPTGEVLDRSDDYGACCESERTIYIDNGLRLRKNRDLAWETFVHEVQHAINHEWGRAKIKTAKGQTRSWLPISHARIAMNELPMAALILENPGLFGLVIK